MTFPSVPPPPEEENPTPASPDSEAESPKPGPDSTEEPDANFPMEEEPIDLSEIYAARDFKPDMDFIPSIEVTPPTRRRRPRRSFFARLEMGEAFEERLEDMARRATPTVDLFTLSLLTGAIISLGYLFDAPALLFVGLLFAPSLLPWAGSILACITGESRFFGQTLGALLTSLALVFISGAIAGVLALLWPTSASQALIYSRLEWLGLLVIAIGTLTMIYRFVQAEEKPGLANLVLAYAFYLPAASAGFGFATGIDGIWPQALFVLIIHLAISLLAGLGLYLYAGFRPTDGTGYLFTGLAVILSLSLIAGLAGLGTALNNAPVATPALPTLAFTNTPTATLPPSPTARPTITPTAEQLSPTPPPPTQTPSPVATITPLPTPRFGRVQAEGDGAVIRSSPAGPSVTTIQNGYLVEILPDEPVMVNGVAWIHVLVKTPSRTIDGWIMRSLVATATPAP